MKKIRIGMVGLGRLGKHHAHNLQFQVNQAELTAACSIVPEELHWAQETLEVPHVFQDYETLLASGTIDAVFIASSTSEHARQIIQGMEAGLHVFSEKPVALEIEDCLQVEATVQAHPDQVFMLGFVRRFDPSYAWAKKKIEEGAIGKPFMVRSQTADMDETAEFMVQFTPKSGGIFLDANAHDIDLARWFLGSELASVYAVGGCYEHPGFEQFQDADNTSAICTFQNGTMANISASRTMRHGHDTHTEIIGTHGRLHIGRTPSVNRVEISDAHGVRQECVRNFYERFEEAFLLEAQEFVACIVENRPPTITAKDGTKVTEAALAFTQSYREKTLVWL